MRGGSVRPAVQLGPLKLKNYIIFFLYAGGLCPTCCSAWPPQAEKLYNIFPLCIAVSRSLSSGTLGAGFVVLKLNVSFVLSLLGLRKKNALHLKFAMKTPTLEMSSERYFLLLGMGIFLREVLKLICSMFMILRVLNNKSNISKLNRAVGFRLIIAICVNRKKSALLIGANHKIFQVTKFTKYILHRSYKLFHMVTHDLQRQLEIT